MADAHRYRHKKRGTTYTRVGVAELQSSSPVAEGAWLMVYRGDDGRMWARPMDEFYDGRFEKLPPADAPEPDDVTALVKRLRATVEVDFGRPNDARRNVNAIVSDMRSAADALERLAADNVRLTRERDEARIVLAAADKGTPIYKAVERVLDEHSAWIAQPNETVTKSIALAAGAAWMAAEKVDPDLAEMDRALAAARAENDMLREALRPFGDVGDYLAAETSGFPNEDDIRLCFGDSDHEVGPRLTHGDFRRARASLEQGETK